MRPARSSCRASSRPTVHGGPGNERNNNVPFLSVMDAIDPGQEYFEDCRRNGVTTVAIVPGDETMIGGQAASSRPPALRRADGRQATVWSQALAASDDRPQPHEPPGDAARNSTPHGTPSVTRLRRRSRRRRRSPMRKTEKKEGDTSFDPAQPEPPMPGQGPEGGPEHGGRRDAGARWSSCSRARCWRSSPATPRWTCRRR
jgi:hypothetical protein